jgi:hypothetical protein
MKCGWMHWKLTICIHKLHVCNTKPKQKGHKFIFTLLLQYTAFTAVICILLSHYFNPAVLIYKVFFTKRQSAAAFGIFMFKLPYICDSIIQRYSSRLSIWRDRVTSLQKEFVSQIQQKHIPFKIKTAHVLCV